MCIKTNQSYWTTFVTLINKLFTFVIEDYYILIFALSINFKQLLTLIKSKIILEIYRTWGKRKKESKDFI